MHERFIESMNDQFSALYRLSTALLLLYCYDKLLRFRYLAFNDLVHRTNL